MNAMLKLTLTSHQLEKIIWLTQFFYISAEPTNCLFWSNINYKKLFFVTTGDDQIYSTNHTLYRMKMYTEFSLATWLRMVKFTESNISEFLSLNFNYKSCNWKIREILIITGN